MVSSTLIFRLSDSSVHFKMGPLPLHLIGETSPFGCLTHRPSGFGCPTGTTVQNLTRGQKGTQIFQMRIARYG